MNDPKNAEHKVLLSEAFEAYKLFMLANGRRPNTITSHNSSFKRYTKVIDPDICVSEIDLDKIIRYRAWLIKEPNYTTHTKKDTERDFRAFLNYLKNRKELIRHDFFKMLPPLSQVLDHELQEKIQLSQNRRVDFLTEDQANLIYHYSFTLEGFGDLVSQNEQERRNYFYNKQNQLIMAMFLGLGLRIGELMNLKVTRITEDQVFNPIDGRDEDVYRIDFERYKTRKHDTLYAVKSTKKVLDEFLKLRRRFGVLCEYLFVGKKVNQDSKYKQINHTYLKRMINKLKRLSGINFSAHTLRHTFGNNFMKKGGNLRDLQMILGHSRITTTERYSHAKKESKLRGIFFVAN